MKLGWWNKQWHTVRLMLTLYRYRFDVESPPLKDLRFTAFRSQVYWPDVMLGPFGAAGNREARADLGTAVRVALGPQEYAVGLKLLGFGVGLSLKPGPEGWKPLVMLRQELDDARKEGDA